jgi:hypothetical protein
MQNVPCECRESPAAQPGTSKVKREVGAVTWNDVSEDALTSFEKAP